MNLLDIAQTAGRTYKRVSAINGGEYHGPCPACGGDDRFHIWPFQGEHGTFWCRKCPKSGDAVQYLIEYEGKSFPEACKIVGKEIQDEQEYQTPRFKKPAAAADFTPRETLSPGDLWQQHALKLVDWAHEQLLNDQKQLAWLAGRGLDLEAVKKYRLGWNPGENGNDLYRAREAWGLDTVLNDKNRKKKLWLPIGLIIPYFCDGQLQRIRIRRPEGAPRYYFVPGSSARPMILGADAQAFVIIEAELDAILIHHLAGDLVGTISQGNSSAKPDMASFSCLQDCLAVLVALDSDEAGMAESLWWLKQFPQAERHPVPVGKDPGESFAAGIDLREWIKIGLPPILTLPKAAPVPVPTPAPLQQEQDDTISGADIPASPATEPAAEIHIGTSTISGKKYIIVPDLEARRFMITENPGVAVFTYQEILKLKGLPKEAAEKFIIIKETFGAETEIESVKWEKETI